AARTKIFAVGVGSAVTGADSVARLQGISGPDRFPATAFGTADYMLVTNFGDLEDELAKLAGAICGSSASAAKPLDPDGDGAFDDDPTGWRFEGSLTGATTWVLPSAGDASTPKSIVVDSSGVAGFQWRLPNETATATFSFTEDVQQGFRVVDVNCSGAGS